MAKNNERNEGKEIGLGLEVGRQGYEASVVSRMQGRAGAYTRTGAPGNALEIMANDRCNLAHLAQPDTVTKLTKSSTAKQVDAVTMKGGKVVERIQYKDTVSNAGVKKTLDQAASGKYRQAQLRGTKEAAEKFNAAAEASGVSKRMKSTGISHDVTQRVGDKFTKQPIKPASMMNAAKTAAGTSVCITAATETVKGIVNGDSIGDCTANVLSKSAESGITAVAATGAGELAADGIATVLLTTGVEVPPAAPFIAGIGAALAVGKVVNEVTDGMFDDIASDIGNAVDDIVTDIKDAVEEVGPDLDEGFDNAMTGFGALLEAGEAIGDILDSLFSVF